MIPDIGLMVGAYIILRCTSFLTRDGDQEEHVVVKGLAVVVILLTLISTYDLVAQGTSNPQPQFGSAAEVLSGE